MERWPFPREEHTNWLSSDKWSVIKKKKTRTDSIIQIEQVVFMKTHVYTYMDAVTIRTIRHHEFEDQKMTYGKVWRVKREGRVVTKLCFKIIFKKRSWKG